MPTFTRKYLKDNDGNYLATAGLADMQYHSDGKTVEVKLTETDNLLGNEPLTTTAQTVTGAINELKGTTDEVVAARTDANGTYNTLDERLDAMDIKIAAAGGGGTIDLSAYQMKEDNGLQTTSKQVVGAINEINDDMLVLEDFVGNGTTVNDVTTRVATLESDYTAINNELTDSRTDTDGTVHGTLGQRLDEIEGSYLPLTGGTVSGITEFQDLVKAKCYSIGDDMVLNKPFDDSLDVGNSLATHTVNLCSAQNPKWWTGADKYDLVTSFGATMINNSSLSWGLTSGNIVEILTVDDSDVFRAGDSTINSVIHGKDIYIEPTNGKVYVQGGNLNVRGHAVENASSYGFANNYIANMQDGLYIANITSNADLTIRPNTDKVTFTTTGSKFNFDGGLQAHDLITIENIRIHSNVEGLWVTNNNNNRMFNILAMPEGTIFNNQNNPFIFHGVVNTKNTIRVEGTGEFGGSITPIISGEHWVGNDATPFWGMRCAGGGFNQASDENLKEDIRTVSDEDYFDMIKGTEVKSYLYKQLQDGIALVSDRTQETVESQNDLNVGIIAQEMSNYDVGKYILNCNEQGSYSVNIYNYTASVHSALRHEISLREELQEKYDMLEQQYNDLQVQLEEIKNHVGL